MTRTLKCILIILAILIVDQVVKIIVKTNMTLYEQIPVFGNWFIIHFVENRGMAFGMNLPGDNGKVILSIFRLLAIGAISYYLHYLIKLKAHTGLLITMSLVLAGAIGNMIDSAFYGLIFSETNPAQSAVMFPSGGGYDTFLHGNVVDMFYFPLFSGVYPDWVPRLGGQSFTFFRPVFNISDASISVAVVILLFRQNKYYQHLENQKKKQEPTEDAEPDVSPKPSDTSPL